MFKKKRAPLTRSTLVNPFAGEFPLHVQQEDIVLATNDNDVIIVDSIAGSSKTCTQVVMAHNNHVDSLYLTFSKALATEAEDMFPDHVDCRTIHSLAYREKGVDIAHKLSRPRGKYKNVAGTGSEIAKYYKIPTFEVSDDYEIKNTLLGLMVKQTLAKYEASNDESISKEHLPFALINTTKNKFKSLSKKDLNKVFTKVYKEIIYYAEQLWVDRQAPKSPVLATHDSYVKMWALTNPIIRTRVLYCDELQDASMVFMGVVQNQVGKCKLVLVGDPDQNLYAWRYSVNGLALVEGKKMELAQSFRYGQDAADLAMKVLDNGRKMKGFPAMNTKVGASGIVDLDKHYVKLFRMNATLLQEALSLISQGKKVNIHVDVQDYVKMLESGEALYSGKVAKVKHEDIIPFDTWEELKEEAKSGGILSRVYNTVKNGNTEKTVRYLKSHKNCNNPDVTLMSCHRAKGNTFDYVILADDFESNYNKHGEWVGIDEAEKRLLYVGVTRAKLGTQYNETVKEIVERYEAEEQSTSQEETIEDLLTSEIDEYYEDGRILVGDTIYDNETELLAAESADIPWYDPDNEEWMITGNNVEVINISPSSCGGAEQAGYELQSVVQMEALRDDFANHTMSDFNAYENGFVDSLGCDAEMADFKVERILPFTEEVMDNLREREVLKLDLLVNKL